MISKTNSNERSWAIQIIKDVEKYSQRKNYIIKEVGGEVTISNGNKKMFPDILLFADDTRSCILQGWEIKMPDISIFDTSFINDAWRKAEVLGLNSTFIWNFRYGVLYVKNKTTNKFEESARWDISKHISKKREDVTIFEHIWKKTLFEAVDVINDYLTTNKYREITIGEAVSSTVVNEIINNNKDLVANHLKKTSKSNLVLHSFLQVWWDDVKDEYIKDESNISSAYAKVLLLNWITKFILAHLISQKNSEAHSLILEINNESTPKQALNIFEKITKRFDFYSIFNPLDYQEIIPNITWTEILELHSFLITNGANVLNQDDLQKILENTTSLSNRLIIGQFTTPKKLAEFMVKSVMT